MIAIHDVGENADGLPFIVMEYATDGTVADRFRERPVAPEHALQWLEQTAEALDARMREGSSTATSSRRTSSRGRRVCASPTSASRAPRGSTR